MRGPDVVWYLCVAGFLFCTGALGVLIRRSPLIVPHSRAGGPEEADARA
jgi:hypothetical protein